MVLEANTTYWDPQRFPRLHRIIFDNTLGEKDAVELVKTTEGQVDLVTGLRPLDTLRVAQSPLAKVVKKRATRLTVVGMFNMRKTGSPWMDVRLRQAANLAINREDFIQYATKGNGVIVPALVPAYDFGYDPALPPYPFDPGKARQLLREAGYPNGIALRVIAPEAFEVQATVISKMLEQVGFQVEVQIFDIVAYNQKTLLSHLDQPAEQQAWDIALNYAGDMVNFPLFEPYRYFALDGPYDWVTERPELRHLYEQVLHTVDREAQQALLRQMERHTSEQAYFLFLYSPIQLYAVNKAVEFVPYASATLIFAETGVTEQHWSVRKQGAAVQE